MKCNKNIDFPVNVICKLRFKKKKAAVVEVWLVG